MTVPSPRQLSRDLRLRTSPDLRRRRWLVGLSFIDVAIGAIVGLYQTGILRRLPDPPGSLFDSTEVNASDNAYRRLLLPDAFLMLATYAVTAALAAAGGRDRAREMPLLPVMMTAKIACDVATNLRLAREAWKDSRVLCAYSQTATLVSLASLALALPEAVNGLRRLSRR